jgi:hypothetical protein
VKYGSGISQGPADLLDGGMANENDGFAIGSKNTWGTLAELAAGAN